MLGFTTCNVDFKDIKKHPDGEGYQEAYKKYGESILVDFQPFIALSTKPDKMADKGNSLRIVIQEPFMICLQQT